MRFGDGQEAAVSLGSNGEDERLSSQDGQLTNQLAGMCHKQPRLFFAVDHPLVNVEQAGNHKQDAHLLKQHNKTRTGFTGKEEEHEMTQHVIRFRVRGFRETREPELRETLSFFQKVIQHQDRGLSTPAPFRKPGNFSSESVAMVTESNLVRSWLFTINLKFLRVSRFLGKKRGPFMMFASRTQNILFL